MKNGRTSLKRLLSLIVVFAMILVMLPVSTFAADGVTLYLVPNSNWTQSNARFAIYYWNSSGSNNWVSMTDADGDGTYEGTIPSGYTNVIFCRMNPSATANNWDNKWNQTADLTYDGTNNCYTVKSGTWDQGGGTWSTYTPTTQEPEGGEEEEPITGTTVYCINSAKWSAVYAYAWTGSGSGWPGKAMTKTSDTVNGFDVYSYTFDTAYQNIIFNNNSGGQTADLQLQAGQYYDVKSGAWYASLEDVPAVDQTATDVYLVGEFNGWSTVANEFKLDAEGSGVGYVSLELEANTTYEFKIVKSGSWTSCATAITDDVTDLSFSTSVSGNAKITTTEAGTYVFAYTVNGSKLAVTYPVKEEEPANDYYLVGYINNADYNGEDYKFVDGRLTVTFANDSYVVVKDQTGYWYLAENYCTDTTVTLVGGKSEKMLVPGNVELTFTLVENEDGSLTLSYAELTQGGDEGDETTETCKVTLHFANSLNWSAVALYSWDGSDNQLLGGWPGTVVSQDENGFYTHTYEVPSGQDINFIFNNNGGGSQTVDLSLGTVTSDIEKWIRISGESDGKYTCDILDSAFNIVTSPVVGESSVTFNYDGTASSVVVYGSWNNWASSTTLSRDNNGVWTATINDLQPGTYEYKFVVDGSWITDPANTWIQNENSAFIILDPNAEDTNKITINIHYTRPNGDYDGWNMWIWNDSGNYSKAGEVVNGELLTTLTFDNARAVQNVSVIPRLSVAGNEWSAQEPTYFIDLSNIVAGTVDYYITSGSSNGTRVLNNDVLTGNKLSSVVLDYENNTIIVTTAAPVQNAQFGITGSDTIAITGTSNSGNTYTLSLNETLDLVKLYQYKVIFEGYEYAIDYTSAYATDKFAAEYTYIGDDLGANWYETSTTFRVWAPTAEKVVVMFYATGSDAEEGAAKLGGYLMNKDVNGTWVVTVEGDLNGVYYTYAVTVDGETVEACDPYAKTTGVNGQRGMVIDLDSTDPDGWEEDTNPNPSTSYTDAVIYELHVRDFSIDASSGIIEDYQGKFLAFTQEGSTVNGEGGIATGIDYLKSLGVTHVHLLPVYDYGSVDETKCENFNWGYDPVNYNVPEGSYSTDPYSGEVRVEEFKEMVMALHEAGISVIMDVVYNHVYDAGEFGFNKIVPYYFSRQNSNGSGCGNDTASEREMVHKYIVESVLYWTEEYHVDGFRFDLVGLLDTKTINTLVEEVHEIRPDVIFYGEGWTLGTNVEPGYTMATQQNSAATPNFAYFSDTIRDLLAGNNGGSLGFVSGATGKEGSVIANFLANPGWSSNPTQIVQYASCHDNYTLLDKLILSTGAVGITDDVISMNNLTAAIYMTAQGIPFIHAGEEMLREKLNDDGTRNHNSYNSSDSVNSIKWDNLETEEYADTVAYYQGLIAFRKAHEALRMTTSDEISANIQSAKVGSNVVAFLIDGYGVDDDDIFVIFNANSSAVSVNLPKGTWNVCVDKEDAGTETLYTAEVAVQVNGISAMILTREDEGKNEDSTSSGSGSDTITVYFSNNKYWNNVYAYYWGGSATVTWPGEAMTWVETNDYGENIYSVTVPADTTNIIFHNNAGTQTVDLDVTGGGVGYYCDSETDGKWECGTYSYGDSSAATGGFTNDGIYTNHGEYYLFGWINNDAYASEGTADAMGAYKFDENGQVTVKFDRESYVGVKTTGNEAWYMTDGWLGNVTSATLYNTNALGDDANKLLIPGGVEVTLTLTENADGTLTLRYEVLNSNAVADESGIQDGVTLHCWNWSFAEIEANMALIAEMGFTAIQTSPVQPIKEATTDATDTVSGCWWVYYQPVGFYINDDEGNVLGTKAELESMIETAHKYGVKVIVDVVANHLANQTGNDLSTAIPADLRNDADIWHNISVNVADYTSRYQETQLCVSGLPDLNTASEKVQQYVLDFLTECIDIGVDGFRFDAAKHIETDDDELAYESDFWNNVIGGAESYATGNYGKDIYVYGEVLDTISLPIAAYTKFMSVTDNSWGNTLRENIGKGIAAMAPGYDKAANASSLVIWAESHDTYATDNESQSSDDETTAEINKTWALVAARADAMGLYLARPESVDQLLGVASITGWANDEVKAVNKFHNAFVGQSEVVSNEDGISYVERGTSGAVLVNAAGNAAEVSVTAYAMADGTYVDQLTGNIFLVENGVITGSIGDTGIAVVYNTYAVIITETEGGTVTSSHDAAAEGETVTITVTPDEGKLTDWVVVTDENGNAVEVTDNGDGTYSFIQPGCAVTVTVTFKDAPVVEPENPEDEKPEDTKPEDTKDEDTSKEEDSSDVKTGDGSHIGTMLAMMVISLLAVLVLLEQRRRAVVK